MLTRFKPKRKTTAGDKVSLQTKSFFGVNKGINLSNPPIEIEDMYLRWANNVYVEEGKIKKRNGYIEFGTETPLAGDPVLNISQFFKYDGTEYLCAFTTKNAYLYNTTTHKWDIITPGVVVCDCESAWTASANVTSTAATDKRYGTYSAKHVIADAFTTGLASYFNFSSVDLHTYTHLYLYIKSSIVLAAGDLQILFDNTNNCASPLESLDIPAIPIADTWYEFCIPFADASALTAIVSVGLKVINDKGACSVFLDNISAVTCFTGDSDDKIITEQIYDDTAGETKFIFTNGVDAIKSWNGTGNFADLSGSPNKAKRLINFEHYLMLFYTYVGSDWAPQRVEWPLIGKPTTWTGSGSGNGSLAGNSDFIEGAEHSRSGLEIYKTNSISSCTFQGGVDPFVFEENKIKNCGLLAVGSLKNLGDTRIFLGKDNVYIYDGFTVKPVGNKIVKRLIDEINPAKLNLIHSHIIKNLNLYLLFVPSTNSLYSDFCWVYNYVEDTWNFWKFADSFTASGYYKNDGQLTIGDLTQKIGNLKFTIGSRFIQNLTDFSVFGSSNGYIYKYDYTAFSDNGEAIDGYIDTKSYVFSGINLFSMLCQISLFGKGGDITVYVSVDDGVNFVTIGTVDQNTTTELGAFLRKIDQIGDRFMVRLRNATVDEWFEITGWELEYIERTRVVK